MRKARRKRSLETLRELSGIDLPAASDREESPEEVAARERQERYNRYDPETVLNAGIHTVDGIQARGQSWAKLLDEDLGQAAFEMIVDMSTLTADELETSANGSA